MDIKCPHCSRTITTAQQKAIYPTPLIMPCPYCNKEVNIAEANQKVWEHIRSATQNPPCPKCGSEKTQVSHVKGLFKNVPIRMCLSCGHTWKF